MRCRRPSCGTPSRSRSRRSTSAGGPYSRRTPCRRLDLSTVATVVGSDGYFGGLERATASIRTRHGPRPPDRQRRVHREQTPRCIGGLPGRDPGHVPAPDGTRHLGPFSSKLIDEIKAAALSDCLARSTRQKDPAAFCATNAYDPYDLAEATKAVLRSSEFRYETDITGLECDDLSTVECFAQVQAGLLPAVRHDDGHGPAIARRAHPVRPGLAALDP